jgi:hypothetical protein
MLPAASHGKNATVTGRNRCNAQVGSRLAAANARSAASYRERVASLIQRARFGRGRPGATRTNRLGGVNR